MWKQNSIYPPEEYSAGVSFFVLARSTKSFHLRDISNKSIFWAPIRVGVIRPPSKRKIQNTSFDHNRNSGTNTLRTNGNSHCNIGILVVLDAIGVLVVIHIHRVDDGVLAQRDGHGFRNQSGHCHTFRLQLGVEAIQCIRADFPTNQNHPTVMTVHSIQSLK
jgi:hypothetical protein